MGEGVINREKSQNSTKKNCIKSFQCPEQISQEERVFIISSKKLWLLYIYIFKIIHMLNYKTLQRILILNKVSDKKNSILNWICEEEGYKMAFLKV